MKAPLKLRVAVLTVAAITTGTVLAADASFDAPARLSEEEVQARFEEQRVTNKRSSQRDVAASFSALRSAPSVPTHVAGRFMGSLSRISAAAQDMRHVSHTSEKDVYVAAGPSQICLFAARRAEGSAVVGCGSHEGATDPKTPLVVTAAYGSTYDVTALLTDGNSSARLQDVDGADVAVAVSSNVLNAETREAPRTLTTGAAVVDLRAAAR